MRKKMIMVTALLIFVSISMLSMSLKEELEISLEEKQVQELSGSGLKLVFYVNFVNSSTEDYYLARYSYRFFTGYKEYLRMDVPLDQGLRVPAMADTMIALPVKITYDLLFHTAPEIEQNEMVQCTIKGEFEFLSQRRRRKTLPFDFNGEFPIFRLPEVKIEAININDLSIAGADFDLQVNFINYNDFELLVNRIHYSVRIDGHMMSTGNIPGDKSIAKHGEKNFSLNALVNFYEVGKDIYGFFQKNFVDCRFSGEIELDTVWGIINSPFDVKENVVIVKK